MAVGIKRCTRGTEDHRSRHCHSSFVSHFRLVNDSFSPMWCFVDARLFVKISVTSSASHVNCELL